MGVKSKAKVDGPAADEMVNLLKVAQWYVNDFWTTTTDRSHREKAWEHMEEFRKAIERLEGRAEGR